MSDTDSFIEEVTEEVRRDRVFQAMKRYGWIGVLGVVLIVGGAAWNEWQKAQTQTAAENAGDAIIAALAPDTPAERIKALDAAMESVQTPGAKAVVALLKSAEEGSADQPDQAVASLEAIASNGDLPEFYRQIASFKTAIRDDSGLSVTDRRIRLEALAAPGGPLWLLASEQLAYLDIQAGDTDAAVSRLQELVADAGVTDGLRRRAAQVIVALGGTVTAPTGDQ